MRVRTVALWSVVGMVLSSAVAMAIPAPARSGGVRAEDTGGSLLASKGGTSGAETKADEKPGSPSSHFTAGQTLMIDGRLGHASLSRASGKAGETFLFASVTGAETTQATAPPVNLAIVIDRSGSMAGQRMANALAAALGTVDRMRDEDSVTVVSFDTAAKVVVTPTRVTASARPGIQKAIRSIALGGDTCISCGLEEAMRQLDTTVLGRDQVNRMILLSDGEATHGVKDAPGFRQFAARMRDRGFAISTMGVDVNFDEKIMAAIAEESNGRHYFVANASALPAVFAQEFQSVESSIAAEAELVVELAPGVDVDEVLDRSFRREGRKVIVPFGTFSAKQEKTLLMKLRVPADREGSQPVASMRLAYRDLVQRADGNCKGELALDVKSDGTAQVELDPFVAARVERSKTSRTLTDANKLFEKGDVQAARDKLAKRDEEVRAAKTQAVAAAKAAPAKAGRSLDSDFGEQSDALTRAQTEFRPSSPNAAPPAPATQQGRAAVRGNQSAATDMSF